MHVNAMVSFAAVSLEVELTKFLLLIGNDQLMLKLALLSLQEEKSAYPFSLVFSNHIVNSERQPLAFADFWGNKSSDYSLPALGPSGVMPTFIQQIQHNALEWNKKVILRNDWI